jgi:Ca-activated chloride channel homolog
MGANPSAMTIHRRVEEVRLTFSVEDRSGPVKNLAPDAFTVYDNARPVSSLTAFSQDSGLPLRIGLLIDRSDSVRKEFPGEQAAAQRFLQAVLRPGVDSIFLLDFTHQLNFRRPALGNPQMLTAEVSALAPGGQTALYDAVYGAAHFELMTADESQPVRRVIVLLSDGEDNYSRHALDDAIAAAQLSDISIYSITVHASAGYYPGDVILEALAEATGGRAFVLPDLKRLDGVFSEIQDELRNEYSVAFHPPSADQCGFHSLVIRLHDPKLRVHARQGYFACIP